MLAQQFNSHLTRGDIAGLHVEAAAFLCPKCKHKMGRGILSGFETTTSWSTYRKVFSTFEMCTWAGLPTSSQFKKKRKKLKFPMLFWGENGRKWQVQDLSQMSLKCLSSCFHCWIHWGWMYGFSVEQICPDPHHQTDLISLMLTSLFFFNLLCDFIAAFEPYVSWIECSIAVLFSSK